MTRTFLPGDPAPHFACRSSNNNLFHFNTVAGYYIILTFFGSSTNPEVVSVLDHIYSKDISVFDDHRFCFFGVSVDPDDEKKIKQRVPGIRFFWDFDSKISLKFGAIAENPGSYRPFTLVLDPLLRVIANIPLLPAAAHNAKLDQVMSNLPPIDDYAGVKINAPILIVPRVFEPEFCRMLIEKYNENGGKESGFMRESDGKTVGVYDNSFKRRRDYNIEDESLVRATRQRIRRFLLPEIKRAFQYDATRMERYMVACYDSESGGFFRPHRDNTTKGTAHRQFAVTLNLNAEEFEGGNLRFPEFGTQTYRAPTGGAVVFSCSLLHEATPVTKGMRYAFLPFLYDDNAAKIREENLGFLTGETINLNQA